jgi:hypothetical protein
MVAIPANGCPARAGEGQRQPHRLADVAGFAAAHVVAAAEPHGQVCHASA